MAGSKVQVMFLVFLVVLSASERMRSAEAAISCGTVTSDLINCISYLTGKTASVPANCCNGVKALYSATKGLKSDRVTACNCIQKTAKTISGLNAARVSSLPGTCGVNLGYSLSTSTNCASYVKFRLHSIFLTLKP